MKYLDRFTIASTTEGGRFEPSENIIRFNISEDRNDPRGSYYTFFHEIAHAIDYYYGIDNGYGDYSSDSFTIDGKKLNDHIYYDVEVNLREELKTILDLEDYNHLVETKKQEIVENLTDNLLNQDKYINTLTTEELQLHKKLIVLYSKKLDGPDHNTASDTYGGVTINIIKGSYKHKDDYWLYSDGTRRREPNRETLAEYYGRIMVPESESKVSGLKSIDYFLPKSKKFIDKILDEMNKE